MILVVWTLASMWPPDALTQVVLSADEDEGQGVRRTSGKSELLSFTFATPWGPKDD